MMQYVLLEMGQRIKRARKEKSLTQEQLAEACNISVSFMGHIERGSRIPSIETLCALCRALDVSSDYLLGLAEEAAMKPFTAAITEEEWETGLQLLRKIIQ